VSLEKPDDPLERDLGSWMVEPVATAWAALRANEARRAHYGHDLLDHRLRDRSEVRNPVYLLILVAWIIAVSFVVHRHRRDGLPLTNTRPGREPSIEPATSPRPCRSYSGSTVSGWRSSAQELMQ
jgi:hypothetical protein